MSGVNQQGLKSFKHAIGATIGSGLIGFGITEIWPLALLGTLIMWYAFFSFFEPEYVVADEPQPEV